MAHRRQLVPSHADSYQDRRRTGLGLDIVLWVVGEGIAYITGAVLYSFKKVPYIHSVFHVFVILGDICHMIATWKVIQMFIQI